MAYIVFLFSMLKWTKYRNPWAVFLVTKITQLNGWLVLFVHCCLVNDHLSCLHDLTFDDWLIHHHRRHLQNISYSGLKKMKKKSKKKPSLVYHRRECSLLCCYGRHKRHLKKTFSAAGAIHGRYNSCGMYVHIFPLTMYFKKS